MRTTRRQLLLEILDAPFERPLLLAQLADAPGGGVDLLLQDPQPLGVRFDSCFSHDFGHQSLHPKRRTRSAVRALWRSFTSSWVSERSREL